MLFGPPNSTFRLASRPTFRFRRSTFRLPVLLPVQLFDSAVRFWRSTPPFDFVVRLSTSVARLCRSTLPFDVVVGPSDFAFRFSDSLFDFRPNFSISPLDCGVRFRRSTSSFDLPVATSRSTFRFRCSTFRLPVRVSVQLLDFVVRFRRLPLSFDFRISPFGFPISTLSFDFAVRPRRSTFRLCCYMCGLGLHEADDFRATIVARRFDDVTAFVLRTPMYRKSGFARRQIKFNIAFSGENR